MGQIQYESSIQVAHRLSFLECLKITAKILQHICALYTPTVSAQHFNYSNLELSFHLTNSQKILAESANDLQVASQ